MKTKILALALVAAAPFAASADVSYNYVDLSYQLGGEYDFGFGTADTDGYALVGSYGFSDNWFVQLDYSSLGTDPDIGDADSYAISGGWHGEALFVTLGYQSADYFGLDDSGYNIDVGFRTMIADSFELNGHVGMSDLGDVGSGVFYGIGAVYMFSDTMGVSFNYDMGTLSDFATVAGLDVDATTYGLGLRVNFN